MKKIGLIGGSGLEDISGFSYEGEETVETPYGKPSAPYKKYRYNNIEIYSLARHGINHEFAPHKVNYRANIYGFKSLQVDEILTFSAVGGINLNYKTGDLVVSSDAIDNTSGRDLSFYEDSGTVIHIDMSEPFCPSIRSKILEAGRKSGIELIDGGVYVCTNGPRFETPAEIKMYRLLGGDMAGMTLFPELTLAKEQGICYGQVCLITNLASGVEDNKKLTSDEVIEEGRRNSKKIQILIKEYLDIQKESVCNCKNILSGAVIAK